MTTEGLPSPTTQGDDPAPRPVRDLRLIPSAIAAWACAFVATGVSPRWGLAICLAITVALVLTVAHHHLPGDHASLVDRSMRATALLALGAALAASVASTARVAAVTGGPVDELARLGASAEVRLVVTSDPHLRPGRTVGMSRTADGVVLHARIEEVVSRGVRRRTRVPVILLAPTAGWEQLLPGQSVVAHGRLSPPKQGKDAAAVVLVRGPPESIGPPSTIQRVAGSLRAGLRDAVAGRSEGPRGLVPALVVGDTSRMPPALVDDFRTSGLTHLTAVSGGNVVFVLLVALALARWMGVRGRGLPAVGLIALIGFVVLARPEPSVLRAAAMGVVAVAAVARGGRRAGLPSLAAAVLVLVLVDPWLSRSYGFILSALATGALLVVAPSWKRRLARYLPAAVAEAIAVPAAAQAVCGPVVAVLSSQLSLVAIPANLLAAPAVGPTTVLGVITALVAPISPWVAQKVGFLASVPAAWIVTVGERSAAFPYAAVPWPGSVLGAIALAVATLGVVLLAPRLLRHRKALALLAVVGLLVMRLPPDGWPPKGWVAVFCDVGQGDAAVLSTGPHSAVVVDAGPDPKLADRCLRDLGVKTVSLVVLTHFHADHVEGLPGVLRGRSVAEIEVTSLDDPPDETQRVARWASAANVKVLRAAAGEERQAGPVHWRVLWPQRLISDGSAPNNASIVMAVETHGLHLLLTGDVEPPAQSVLLAHRADLAADVVKVPHHGSRNQDPRLAASTGASVAVIEVGAGNTYGHPNAGTISQWKAAGADVRRTDRDGDVAIIGDADHLRVLSRH